MKTKRLAVFAACMTLSGLPFPSAFAQTAKSDGAVASSLFATSTYGRLPRDFSGIIWGGVPPGSPVILGPAPEAPQPGATGRGNRAALTNIQQPWVREIVETYKKVRDQSSHASLNPGDTCHPSQMPGSRAMEGVAAIQFLISPKIILMVHEDNNLTRIIYMDQEHPKNLRPRWLGHSVGKWEGDTLVVDTIGYNDLGTGIIGAHTTQLHTIERFRLIDVGRKLEDKVVYDDPGSLTKPYETTLVFLPARDQGSPVPERSCESDNNLPVPMATEATAGKG